MSETNPPRVRTCGTMHVHHRLLATNPRYAFVRQRIEEQAFRAEVGMRAGRSGCTQIPIIVHVVWKTSDQNISQEQIDSQITVLNRDFRKKNTDGSIVPAPFKPLVADARITFVLATIDPQGKPTDGVIRRQTDKDFFGDDDSVKFTAQGGSDAWPADEYLNIWVCQLSGGLLGYAQFPGGPAETDGVVITHTGFGTIGTAAAPFNLGRTTTHEIGHWLNLRHIWGDDGDGCGGSDFVADTPNQGGPNYGKPTFPVVSCSNGPNGDMFMNYMDYVDDAAMVMFTEGQVSRMQTALDGPRSSIGITVSCFFENEPPKSLIKELPKDSLKDAIKEPSKELPKDNPKDFIKEPPKELPADPPKTPLESPTDLGIGPVVNPVLPGIGQQPFVLATGGGRGAIQQLGTNLQPPPAGTGEPTLAAYRQLLTQYAQLHTRGLLDAQGMQAWQQTWAAYVQLGGS